MRHTKRRPTVLALLMLLSVTAMGTAFVGEAAADNEFISVTPEIVETTTTNLHKFTFDIAADSGTGGEGTVSDRVIVATSDQSIRSVTGLAATNGSDDVDISLDRLDSGDAYITVTLANRDYTTPEDIRVTGLFEIQSNTGTNRISVASGGTSGPFGAESSIESNIYSEPQEQALRNLGDATLGPIAFQGERLGGVGATPGQSDGADALEEYHNEQGLRLENPIPEDQPVGSYTDSGVGNTQGYITIREPKISDFEVRNDASTDVSGGVLLWEGIPSVYVESNFKISEDVELTIVDENGLVVTAEFLEGFDAQINNLEMNDSDAQTIPLSTISPIDSGQYTFRVEGGDDFDFGAAVQSTSVRITDSLTPEIELISASVTQGETVDFTITTVDDDTSFVLAMDACAYAEYCRGTAVDPGKVTAAAEDVFRDVGDVVDRTGDGTDYITAELVTVGGVAQGSIDTTNLDTGDITIELYEGEVSGDAVDSVGLTVDPSAITPRLELQSTTPTQGERITYSISYDDDDATVMLAIDAREYVDFSQGTPNNPREVTAAAEDVFRDVGDVVDRTGDGTDYITAELLIDNGEAAGSIDTTNLDTGDITIELYEGVVSGDAADSVDFTVDPSAVTLDSPTGPFVLGSQVTVSGTATAAVDDVAIYARSGGDWEYVDINGGTGIEVNPDGTFEETEVTLSGDTLGNNILSQTGSHLIGVIDLADVSDGTAISDPRSTLTTTEFTDSTSAAYTLYETPDDPSVTFTTYNVQVATQDSIVDVDGTDVQSAGGEVAVIFIDSSGNQYAETISVDTDGSFDADIDLSNPRLVEWQRGLEDGVIRALLVSAQGDGTIGSKSDDIEAYVRSTGAFDASGSPTTFQYEGTVDQIIEQIQADTIDDTGSDDFVIASSFRLRDAETTMSNLPAEIESGDSLTVAGRTNRNPDEASIIVEVFDAEGSSELIASTDEWGSDGAWSVTFDAVDLELGTYSIKADDSISSDIAELSVVDEEIPLPQAEQPPESAQSDTPVNPSTSSDGSEPGREFESGSTDNPGELKIEMEEPIKDQTTNVDTNRSSKPEPQPTEEPAEEETPAETPGFGLLVALTALVAAGFLALRRLD